MATERELAQLLQEGLAGMAAALMKQLVFFVCVCVCCSFMLIHHLHTSHPLTAAASSVVDARAITARSRAHARSRAQSFQSPPQPNTTTQSRSVKAGGFRIALSVVMFPSRRASQQSPRRCRSLDTDTPRPDEEMGGIGARPTRQ